MRSRFCPDPDDEPTQKIEQRPCGVHAFMYVVGEGCPKCRADSSPDVITVITARPAKLPAKGSTNE